jgi:hypothetical protein
LSGGLLRGAVLGVLGSVDRGVRGLVLVPVGLDAGGADVLEVDAECERAGSQDRQHNRVGD